MRAICGLFSAPDAKPVGRIIAVIGAKGGVGASTIAHNIAWAIARDLALDSVVADLDLAFGTAGLDYNQDPPQGIADAVFSPDRIDTAFVDRLLSKCTDHLSLLAAPATLERVYDFGAEAFDSIFDTLRSTVPCIVLDVPHQWTGWTKRTLITADDILIVAAPDLANLRNAKNLFDLLQRVAAERPPPALLPQPGRRAEAAGDQAGGIRQGARGPSRSRSFRSSRRLFGTAANNGQMIAEIVGQAQRTAETFRQLAQRPDRPRRGQESQAQPAAAAARQAAEARVVDRRGVSSCSASVAASEARPAAPHARRRSRVGQRACADAAPREPAARRFRRPGSARRWSPRRRRRRVASAPPADGDRHAPLGELLRDQGARSSAR